MPLIGCRPVLNYYFLLLYCGEVALPVVVLAYEQSMLCLLFEVAEVYLCLTHL